MTFFAPFLVGNDAGWGYSARLYQPCHLLAIMALRIISGYYRSVSDKGRKVLGIPVPPTMDTVWSHLKKFSIGHSIIDYILDYSVKNI